MEIVDDESFILQPVPVSEAVWPDWVRVLREGIQLVELREACDVSYKVKTYKNGERRRPRS